MGGVKMEMLGNPLCRLLRHDMRDSMGTTCSNANQWLLDVSYMGAGSDQTQVSVDINNPAKASIEFKIIGLPKYGCARGADYISEIKQQGLCSQPINLRFRGAMYGDDGAVIIAIS